MEKKIEDYLHLYIGCEAKVRFVEYPSIPPYWEDGIHTITGLHIDCMKQIKSIKPILRPLNDMTEDEASIWTKLYHKRPEEGDTAWFVQRNDAIKTAYLLKQGFDIFGLIDAGLAIDKTTHEP